MLRCYPYECECGEEFDVYKNLVDIDRVEECPVCKSSCDKTRRRIAGTQQFFGERVEDAEYCPTMGQVVKSRSHRRQLAKDRGMVEVGNDYKSGTDMHDTRQKDLEKELDKRWEKV